MVKFLTGSRNFAPAALGKILGRSPENIKSFVEPKTFSQPSVGSSGDFDEESMDQATEVLGLIYRHIVRQQEKIEEQRLYDEKQLKIDEAAEEERNQQLIKALTARRKKKTKKQKTEETPQKVTPKEKPSTETPRELFAKGDVMYFQLLSSLA